MATPLDRQISVVPAWAAIGVGWLVGHALAAVLLGDKSEGDLWFLPWVAVFVLGAPAIARAKIIPGRYAVAFGVIWCVAVGFSLYTPPFEEHRLLRLLVQLAVTVPAAFLLLDRPAPEGRTLKEATSG